MTDISSGARRAHTSNFTKLSLTAAVSVLALSLGANAALAQTAAPAAAPAPSEDTVVVVKGVRASITKSLANKRRATQVIESIVAEDIGKLPDNNVIEALQRVTGVQVTDRAGGEVGTISIRGLPDVVTTWNGRNIFTASNQAGSLQDIPATLVRQIDVYKTRDAGQLETGLAGQVDVTSLRPFDFKGAEISFAARATYLDPAKSKNPQLSALFSNRWHTSNGDFGALINLSDVKTKYRSESVTPGALVPFSSPIASEDMPGYTPLQRIFDGWPVGTKPGMSEAAGATYNFLGTSTQYKYLLSRDAIFQSDLLGDRDRPAANIALQWAPDQDSVYTFEAMYNGYDNTTYNQLLFSFVDWWGNLGANPASTITTYDGTNVIHTRQVGSVYGFNSGDLTTNHTDSYVFALNGKWNIGDKLKLVGDLSHQDSTFHSEFTATRIDRVANQINVNFNTGDGTPSFHFDNDALLTQASTWNVAQFYDNANRNSGSASTASLDGKYDADWGPLTQISFGARFDDRKAEEASRSQSDDAGLGINLATLGSGYQYTNSNFFDGYGDVPRAWMDANGYYIRDHIDSFRNLVHSLDPAFRTTGQLFLHKSFQVDEKTSSAYVMADGDTQLFGHRLRANAGLRYVSVDTSMQFYDWDNVNYVYTGEHSTKKSVSKVLPSFTLRYEPTDQVVLRLNYGETLRRPNFGDLNPELNLTGDLTSVGYGSGSGGNPDLKATHAKSTDLTAEWYFRNDSAIYMTVFNRKIDGLVVSYLHKVTQTGTGLNTSTFLVNTPYNASDGVLNGGELGLTYFPKELPGWFKGLGFQGSLTSLRSSQNVPIQDGSGNVTAEVKSPFFGVSNLSYNATLAYERGPVSARVSYVYRTKFLDRYEAALFANPIGVWRQPEKSVDFQLTYNINSRMSFDIDGVNLTNEKQQEYYQFGSNGSPLVTNFGTVAIGRSLSVGFRYRM